MASMIDIDYDWEAERRARLAHRRRLWLAKILWSAVWVVLTIGFVVAVAILLWCGATHERNERASYNEGFYGVSREVALEMADAGIGMCARELIKEVR